MGNINDQVKQPYISVFDAAGQQIATSMDIGSTVVTRFSYKYDDEDDDRCLIKIQTTDPKLFDNYAIGRGSKLQFIWGYVSGPVSFAATVVVRDISSNYGETEISTELECSDYLTYLKTARADDTDKATIISYIKSQCHKKYNIEIRSGGDTIFRQIKEFRKQKYDYLILKNNDLIPYNPIDQLFKPFNKMSNEEFSLIDSEAMIDGRWFIDPTHEIRSYMENEIPIVSSNRSQFIVMQDLLKACPKGPWFVTGRGDTLLIHNRNMGKEPQHVYKYKAGKKLTIQAKTKYENFETQALSVTGMDPEEMKNYYLDSYREALYKLRSFKEIISDKSLSDDEFKNEVRNYIKMRTETYYKHQVTRVDGAFIQNMQGGFNFMPGQFDSPIWNTGIPLNTVKDHTGEINPDPMIKDGFGTFLTMNKSVLRASWYTVPLMTKDELVTYADNNQRALEMDKEEAKVTLEGDPSLQSQMVIQLLNLQKQHEGSYYIKSCEHVIDMNGYEVSLECIKVTPESVINNTTKEVPFNDADLEKQYKTEKKLFGEYITFTYEGQKHYGKSDAEFTTMREDDPDVVISLEQLLSEGNEDEQLEKINAARKAGNVINVTEYSGEEK